MDRRMKPVKATLPSLEITKIMSTKHAEKCTERKRIKANQAFYVMMESL